MTAREIGLSLEEALQLVLLYAAYEPQKLEHAALRWFSRHVTEGKVVSLLKAHPPWARAVCDATKGPKSAKSSLIRARPSSERAKVCVGLGGLIGLAGE